MAWFHALLIFFTLIFLLWLPANEAARTDMPLARCQNKCGNVNIPYPFGIGTDEACSIDNKNFFVTCNHTFDPPRPFFTASNIDVSNISVLNGEIKVMLRTANDCSNKQRGDKTWARLSKFTFSDSRNKFVAIGCNTMAYLQGKKNGTYSTGCFSLCDSINDVINGSCAGIGCCQTSIPKGLRRYDVRVNSINQKTRNLSFNPCSYAFLAEENWFKFSSADLMDFNRGGREGKVPVVLEWTIGNQTCNDAKRNSMSYGCGPNTDCYEPGNSPGYRCKCKDGYEGNPYLTSNGSCQDVNECSINPCKGLQNICQNTDGDNMCSCPLEYLTQRRNDGVLDCVKPDQQKNLTKIIIGTGIGFLFLLVSISWLYWGFRKRRLMKLKEKFFNQNGGLMLKHQLQREEVVGSRSTVIIFTAEELKKATNKYNESQILGKGGYGTVFKGTLTNGDVVAIKKSKLVDKTQIDQFINEVLVLSQINHRNVVKLLGCCLETEVPLLVYEFITNGTLSEHLHDHESRVSSLSWDNRLRIAAEVAGSLAYLHSSASVPIIHRDVKSTNILLDDSYTAKVSDFGASRLVPIDQTELTTLVQGTLGYLDPEYFLTSQLTDKSDVYSFGVLLAELLTGKTALSFERPEEERSLANYFLSSMKEDRLLQIIDDNFVTDKSISESQLQQVAELTKRCLRVKGEKRPTMKEVTMMLDGLRRASSNPWVFNDADANDITEESEYLLGERQLESYTDSMVVGYDSMNSQLLSSLNSGR